MDRPILVNIMKRFLLGIGVIFIFSTNYAFASIHACSSSTGSRYIFEIIDVDQNAAPISESYNYQLTCVNNDNSKTGKIMFILPPDSRAPGVESVSYKELNPTVAKAPATVTVKGRAPYSHVKITGTVDLFTGAFSGEEEVHWNWLAGRDNIIFDISVNIQDIQLKSDQFGIKNHDYRAGGDVMFFYFDNMRTAAITAQLWIYQIYNECRSNMFRTEVKPSTINFGNIDKQELQQGKEFSKEFSLITYKKDDYRDCKTSTTPKVTLKSNNLINNQTIGIDNGLTLQIENTKGRKIEFNKPISYDKSLPGNVATAQATQKFRAKLQKNPKKEVKTGQFDTTIIYLMEYI